MGSGSSLANVDHPDLSDVEAAVRTCAHGQAAGTLLSTARAVEELRIMTGDFISSDRELADMLCAKAIELGCAVVFDELAGAGIVLRD